MISWIIEWCAHNRFLVFTGVALLVWLLLRIPVTRLVERVRATRLRPLLASADGPAPSSGRPLEKLRA